LKKQLHIANPGKVAALAILFGVIVAAVLSIAVPAFLLHRHYDEALVDARDKLERYRRVTGTREELQLRFDKFKTERNAKSYYLKSNNPALAAAEIQEFAKNIIESSTGKLTSMQVLPPKDEDKYRQVAVNVQFSGTVPAIRKILFKLETSQPYMFVDNFVIRSLMGNQQKNQPTVDPDMMVQFDLSGYMLKGTP
jgi:general secretion pathway protein M